MELFSKLQSSNKEINIKLPWVEKYRPISSNDLILDSFIKHKINTIIESQNIPNMIITGEPGTGKTSTILFIAKNIYNDQYSEYVLELNASDDKGLPIINNTIYPFCRKKKDKNKLIILDEADTITKKAQNLLSNILSEFINSTRFVFICNECSQIIESIQSKCMIIKYPKITLEDLYIKVKYICECENITYTDEGIKCLLFVSMQDIRQIINNLECIFYSVNELTESNIYKLIDKPKSYYINNLLNASFENNFDEVINITTYLINKGYTSNDILLTFMKYIMNIEQSINNQPLIINEKLKLNICDILNNYYIIINDNLDSPIQLYSCIAEIFNYINDYTHSIK
uniref:AAA+ ATPase domain-containing protein n=1 Tax=viral metagenome TaxID=1070528 RepID=A0A6C0H737_9ZZZZ